MSLTLLLRTDADADAAGEAPSLTFDGGRVVIGRGSGCDVRLPDPSVSHRHATVRSKGPELTLVDEKSANGTFVGRERLSPQTPRPLKSGDLIRVGRVWLEVRIDQRPATLELANATRDLALSLVARAMRGLGQDADTRLEVFEGERTGESMALAQEGRAYTIGTDADCDLRLPDPGISPRHAQVVRRGGTILVRDLGSQGGTSLGGTRLSSERDVPWRAPAPLRIGAATLVLAEPAVAALSELEAADDEAMAPEDVPPSPDPFGTRPSRAPSRPEVAALPVRPSAAPLRPSRPSRRARWTPLEMGVAFAAVVLLGLSLVGLVLLLRQ
ncbi:MAG TPA: FHA domain-containing protein [Polyangiaceae bacterium]|jgi:pSer/pThr/pTyr-binding forkhead associated (FHA) protein